MQDALSGQNEASETQASSAWQKTKQRAVLSLMAAMVWVLPHYWAGGATHGAGSWRVQVTLLAGASLTQLAVALCWGAGLDWRARLSPFSAALALALVPLAGLAYAILLFTHHRPLGAVLLAAVSSALVFCLWLLTSSLSARLPTRRTTARVATAGLVALGALFVLFPSTRDRLLPLFVDGTLSNPRDLIVGLGLTGLVLLVPVARIPRRLAGPIFYVHGLVLAVAWGLVDADPSLVESLHSAPLVAGVLGLILS